MLMDRNTNTGGKGKYALILLRSLPGDPRTPEELAAAILANPEAVDFGIRGSDSEFFVIRLKDKYAPKALEAYADAAEEDDQDWSLQVRGMAGRAARHPGRKRPD